jgi:hypothetical protein
MNGKVYTINHRMYIELNVYETHIKTVTLVN